MAKVIELTRSILVSVVIIHVLIHEFCVEGISITEMVKKTNLSQAIIKTIQGEDGEIIDCIDIYKQPAFDHPLLRNHKLQMRPSSYPKGMKAESEIIQQTSWHKNNRECCPVGTIPINRRGPGKNYKSFLHKPDRKPHHKNDHNLTILENDEPVEYAYVRAKGSILHGAQGIINAWKPTLGSPSEASAAQIWIEDQITGETVQAGLQVNPGLYGDNNLRFFVAWHNERGDGCVNLLCPGFVQTNRHFSFLDIVERISDYGGIQYDLPVYIFEGKTRGNWWVKLGDQIIGYWPGDLFSTLFLGANQITWGGLVKNKRYGGHHTTTQMGSGHFASEGLGKAAFIRNLGIVDETHTLRDPDNLVPWTTNPNCYDLQIASDIGPNYGRHFLYGGPGFSKKCP